MRVLVVSAHPDDETLGAGGAIALHARRGDDVSVLILTDGVTARHEVTEPQKAAARKACGLLGAKDVRFCGLPDQRLDAGPLLDVIKPISQLVGELRPEVVYTHHGADVNQDHRAVFAATLVAVRPVGQNPVRRVLSYEVAGSTEWAPPFSEWAFLPNVFVDISATLDTKLSALDAYRETFESEIKPFPHPRSPEAVRIYAQQRGVTVGMRAAEAFVLVRELLPG
jgi:LmbE family N-acetylglucosaminyl deacetylase